MDRHTIAIATNTSYPKWYEGKLRDISDTDKIRGDLALDFFKSSLNKGYMIVVVDGNSSFKFRNTLSKIQGLTVLGIEKAKRSVARRLAIAKCSSFPNIKAIVLTEPEKVSLIECLPDAISPVIENEADVLILNRNIHLFEQTYPKFQYYSENEANILVGEVLRAYGFLSFTKGQSDMIFGPRIFKNDPLVVGCFMKQYILANDLFTFPSEFIDPEQVLNTMFFPIILAEKLGFRIQNMTVPFVYPDIQKQNEETVGKETFIEKRRNQKIGVLIGLIHFLRFLEGKSSKIKEISSNINL